MSNITVVIATYGEEIWREYAKRASASAQSQAPVIEVHGEDLAGARNQGLALVETEYVVHLDADDVLLPGYVNAMLRATADVRVPMVRMMHNNHRQPFFPAVYGHQHTCEPGAARQLHCCRRSGSY
jgi:glycosyltransferase involved in cell wall biosynthesis